MSTERESLSELEKLKEKAQFVFTRISDVEALSGDLGTEQGPEMLDYIQVSGLAKVRRIRIVGEWRDIIATKVTPYFQHQKEEVEQQIERYTVVSQTQAELATIRELFDQGRITQAEFDEAQKELAELTLQFPQVTVKPEQSPAGPEETPLEPEVTPEQEKLAQVELHLDEQKAIIDGRVVKFKVWRENPNFQWETLVYLAHPERINKDIEGKELRDFLEGKGSDSGLGSLISGLRQKIEIDSTNPKIITKSGKNYDSSVSYRLNADGKIIEKVPAEETLDAEPTAKDRQAQVLANIAEIQDKINKGILTNPEAIAKAQEMAKQVGGTIEFIRPQESEKEVEDLEGEINFDYEEQAILARLILDRTGIVIKLRNGFFSLSLKPEEIKAYERTVEKVYSQSEELTNGNLKEAREQVISKVEQLFGDENAEDIILDKFEGDLREILVALYGMNKAVVPPYLFDFLREEIRNKAGKAYIEEINFSEEVIGWIKRIIRSEEEREARVLSMQQIAKSEEERVIFERVAIEEALESSDLEPEVKNEAPEPDDSQLPEWIARSLESDHIETDLQKDKKVLEIEKRDPTVRERITATVEQMAEYHILERVLTPTSIRTYFPRVKPTFLRRAVEPQIRPEMRKGDSHPGYKPFEVVMAVYIKDRGVSLNSRQFGELKVIVNEQIDKKKAEIEKSRSNGDQQ